MHASDLDSKIYGEDFVNRILKSGINLKNIYIDPKKKFILEKTEKGIVKYLGCEVCFSNKLSRDEMGRPKLGNHLLLDSEKIEGTKDLPDVLKLNMYFCPNCHNLVEALLPESLRK
jgi:hypothetical protein